MPLLKKYKLLLIVIILFFIILPLFPSQAGFALIKNAGCIKDGNCSLCDLVDVFVNIGVVILGFIGALTLLAFIYGGLRMLTSGGDTTKAKKGQSILVNSVIGLFIVLFAYAFVVIIINIFTAPSFQWSTSITCSSSTSPAAPASQPQNAGQGGDRCSNAHSGWSCINLGTDLYNKCIQKNQPLCAAGLCSITAGSSDMCCAGMPNPDCSIVAVQAQQQQPAPPTQPQQPQPQSPQLPQPPQQPQPPAEELCANACAANHISKCNTENYCTTNGGSPVSLISGSYSDCTQTCCCIPTCTVSRSASTTDGCNTGFYCATSGTCAKSTGQTGDLCIGKAIDDDNLFCASGHCCKTGDTNIICTGNIGKCAPQ